jgi:hypothetical protein
LNFIICQLKGAGSGGPGGDNNKEQSSKCACIKEKIK